MDIPAVIALIGALIAGTFAAQLGQQFLARRRHHALAWAASLGLYAVGMVALAVGFATGWTSGWFGLYWLTGALLNVPLLAVGQLQLLDSERDVLWWTLGGLAVVWSIAAVLMSTADPAGLAAADARNGIPVGAETYGGELAMAVLRPMTMLGATVVLVGSIWSGVRARRPGVLLIALGVAISASSSAFVRSGRDALVAVVLTAGVAVMYAGFRSAGKPSRRKADVEAASA